MSIAARGRLKIWRTGNFSVPYEQNFGIGLTGFKFNPIGVIRTPWKKKKEAPIQPVFSNEAEGRVVVYPEFAEGLSDLEGFSHIYLLFVFHKSKGYNLKVKPYLDNKKRGVFACRAPHRPNPIGLSVVRLIKVEENVLYIRGADMLDNSPLLDIKPYVGGFDRPLRPRLGWLKKNRSLSR